MKIIGLICLVLGILASVKVFTTEVPKQGSEAYQQGARIGRVLGPVIFLGLGLWLLLRDRSGSARPAPSRPVSAGGVPPRRPPPPVIPAAVPVKIQCGCGQHYAFDVEPVGGRMPATVACPACGADGTEAANVAIAQELVTRAATLAPPQPQASAGRRSWHPVTIVAVAVLALVALVMTASVVVQLMARSRLRSSRPNAPGTLRTWPEASPSPAGRPNSPAGPPGGVSGRTPTPPGRAAPAGESAPVPPDVTAVEVFWGSRWWPATIVRRDRQRAYIHYDGWSASSDEWVTPDRLRPRR